MVAEAPRVAGLNGAAAIDTPSSLEAEARAAVAGAPVDPDLSGTAPAGLPVGPAQPSPEEVLAGYTLIAGELVDGAALAVFPNWQVTPAESGKFAGAMARAFLLWFPDQIIPPKYLALVTLAGVGFEIVQARRDPETGKLRPARLPKKDAGGDTKPQAAAAAAAH